MTLYSQHLLLRLFKPLLFLSISCGLGTLTPSMAAASPLTVQVKPSNGVPQLLVNGVPTIPRMFYGGPGWVPIRINPGESHVSFEFTAIDSEKATEMDFRFDPVPGTVVLSEVHVTDMENNRDAVPLAKYETASAFARDWAFSPPNETNTNAEIQLMPGLGHNGTAGLRICLKPPRNGVWNDTHVYHRPTLALDKGHRYHVDFWVTSDVTTQGISVTFYRQQKDIPYQLLGAANEPFFQQVRLAAHSGVNFVTFPMPVPWPRPGQAMDTSYIDAVCDYLLVANPQVLLIPRINVNAPKWWLDAHPDDEMRWEGRKKNNNRVATVASAVYRREANANLAALLEHLEAKYGDHMAGYHIAGQNSNEWFYEDSTGPALSGFAPADLQNWRHWLAKRYTANEDLQKAWRAKDITLESVEVPTAAARSAARGGTFLDLATEQSVLDWNQYQQDTMVNAIYELAHTVRQATLGRKLVLFFYGYLFEFPPVQMGPANTGHYALRKVLDCPDIDILSAPISYYDRNTAGSAPAMSAAESVRLAGKIWLMEDDTSTHVSLNYVNPPGSRDRAHSLNETVQVLLRNGAEIAMRNMGTWWMDLCKNGWFNDPGMWAALDRFRPVEEEMLRLKQAFNPEVAAVMDEKSMLLLSAQSQAVGQPLRLDMQAFGRMGAPYGQYLQDDVSAGRVPAARLYVFMDAWRLTADERANLLRQTQGKTRLWGYAAGYLDDEKPSLEAMRELTGFQVKIVSPKSTLVTPTEAGKRLGLTTPLEAVEKHGLLTPIFAVVDARPDEILATFPDGSAALALRRYSNGLSLFSGTPVLSPELLRVAAKLAGVHLYTHTDAAVYANGPFLVVHGTQDGSVALDTGTSTPVINVFTGEMLGCGPRLDLPMKSGQTAVLRR